MFFPTKRGESDSGTFSSSWEVYRAEVHTQSHWKILMSWIFHNMGRRLKTQISHTIHNTWRWNILIQTFSGLSWKSGFNRYRLLSTVATHTQEPLSPRTWRVTGSPGMDSLADSDTDTCNTTTHEWGDQRHRFSLNTEKPLRNVQWIIKHLWVCLLDCKCWWFSPWFNRTEKTAYWLLLYVFMYRGHKEVFLHDSKIVRW